MRAPGAYGGSFIASSQGQPKQKHCKVPSKVAEDASSRRLLGPLFDGGLAVVPNLALDFEIALERKMLP